MSKNNFVDNIVKDPACIPETKLVKGYIGKSDKDEYIRLYRKLDLLSYIEFRKSDVIHKEELDSTKSAPGKVCVWLDACTKVSKVSVRDNDTPDKFLNGKFVEMAKLLENDRFGISDGGGENGTVTTVTILPTAASVTLSIVIVTYTVSAWPFDC